METATTTKAQAPITSRAKKRAIFYAIIVVPFLIQFAIFYFYVNIETFILAFQKYTATIPGEPHKVTFAGIDNFRNAFDYLFAAPHYYTHALKFYFFNLLFAFTFALLFSYYLYKRLPGYKVFKYFLFFPNILSGLLFSILFKFVVGDVWMAISQEWFGVKSMGLMDASRPLGIRFGVLVFYNIIIGIGSQVLVYTGTMEGIDPSLVESAQLDGTNILQEFWLLTMPMIWTTFMTFFLTTMTGIFVNQLNLFNFYGENAPQDLTVIGYKMYIDTLVANLGEESIKYDTITGRITKLNYTGLSAVSLLITAFLTPIVLVTRKLMTKYGPSAS